ncbi:glycerate kinase [Acidaminococcus sp. NSJ-142]|jgi:hydroxypyruvate reductase|uniref:glycerate kinase type-2 family protein n=1 Tax=Acidaminococcus TaxID=904 RepID=UPI000CF8A9D1|nr:MULTISPECIES: glycerate kinase [Acidaminococcus]MCD2435141.1 glycerate kinase [Acidaminococcus hominis]MCH4096294.1 glycerate kinase [Acidaminococcus provencensis]RHK02978.1 glycerate kinase [Acidaminococcus sp. AM05-11]
MSLRTDAEKIMQSAITASLPDTAVEKALQHKEFGKGKIVLVAIGKAAWQMAKTANYILEGKISQGIVITKYGHSKGELPPLEIWEAGHPVLDENSLKATERAIDLVSGLTAEDTVLFLISGGGSALFEKPLIPLKELQAITSDLLASGADIVSMNTVRKRLSAVKGGKFAQLCAPAKVYAIVLSDIIGDPLDMIASGPAYPDTSTSEQALEVIRKYKIMVSPEAAAALQQETPKALDNVETIITGSVTELAAAGKAAAEALGYETLVLTTSLACQAKEAGSFLGAIAREYAGKGKKLAFMAGGETVVHLHGRGKGGRNQELALSAGEGISGLTNAAVFSFGSDGTDGPTDAAGGYADGSTKTKLLEQGITIPGVLEQNDAYHALEKTGGLLITGATGTNVNDLAVLLLDEKL